MKPISRSAFIIRSSYISGKYELSPSGYLDARADLSLSALYADSGSQNKGMADVLVSLSSLSDEELDERLKQAEANGDAIWK
jgi:hypothetical protein